MRLMLTIVALAATPAAASSTAAWSAGNTAARTACLRVAGLAAAHASGPILFSDVAGRTAFLVTGRYRQRFLKNQPGQMLCLYDRRTKRAEASEAKGWTAPR